MLESTEIKRFQSPLEAYPEYVKAIGMISIENASLESLLGEPELSPIFGDGLTGQAVTKNWR
jgi:hypothetical protein